ncbi:hypothetical protein JOM56_015242 [Amanita muscaria]
MDSRVGKPPSRALNTNITQFPPVKDGNGPARQSPGNDTNSVSGPVLNVSPSTPAEEPPRYLGSLGKSGARAPSSTPASLSRNRGRAIAPGISNNSLRATIDDAVSLSSLAISGIELKAFGSDKHSREPSTFKGPEPEQQRAVDTTYRASANNAQQETSPQRVSFDHPPTPTVTDKRNISRPLRKSDPVRPPSPFLRALGYRDRPKDNSSPKARSNSPSPSQPRSRATSPLRLIQQWSSNLHRTRSADEPFVPINPFKGRKGKSTIQKPCKDCLSKRGQQHGHGARGSPMPNIKNLSSDDSDSVYECDHIVQFTTIAETADAIRLFFIDTLPRYIYLNLLLRLPALYFSRVAKIFEDAELSKPDVQRMIEAGGGGGFFSLPSRSEHGLLSPSHVGSESRPRAAESRAVSPEALAAGVRISSQVAIAPASQVLNNQPLPCPDDWALPLVSPALLRFKASWETFIDSLMKEWKTLNVVSALLLSAIISIFQTNASSDPVIRNTAFMSLVCALMSLSYGCMYIIRFGSMKSMYQASRWAEEARKSKTSLWWNVWVFLAMPSVWLAWSMVWFIASILSFVWRTGSVNDPSQPPPLSFTVVLIPRIVISSVFLLGLLYFILIVWTLHRYSGSHGGMRGLFNTRMDADFQNSKGYEAAERRERRDHDLNTTAAAVGAVDSKTEWRGRERERKPSGSGAMRIEGGIHDNAFGERRKNETDEVQREGEVLRVVGLGLTTGEV